jgi:hypothetical protein
MWAEQAVFTSLDRGDMAGYHVVARSPGISEADAQALATWSPSSGGLITDGFNRTSINFHPLPDGRFALSRTCQGGTEYSARGQRQLYTHALVFDADALRESDYQPIAIYRDAHALGHLRYRPEPETFLKPVELSSFYPVRDRQAAQTQGQRLRVPPVDVLHSKLADSQPISVPHGGDRIVLAECLLGLLEREMIPEASFSTSLHFSSVRPYWLSLVSVPT